jgi:hypothetical protein
VTRILRAKNAPLKSLIFPSDDASDLHERLCGRSGCPYARTTGRALVVAAMILTSTGAE